MTKVLLTGGNGFIAAHILQKLLDRGHTVTTTVRTESKAQNVRDAHKDSVASGKLSVAVVPDIAAEGAFDDVVKGVEGLEVVLHTASPFHFKWTDPQKELIDPALKGTTSILSSIQAHGPSVTHVVITSSFAAILTESHLAPPLSASTVFSESSWNPVSLSEIHDSPATAYRASKTLAERAAWDFVKKPEVKFTLSTVNPPLVFGPVAHALEGGLDGMNTSNARVADLLRGKWKTEIPDSGAGVIWVDVRDVAEAHIRAFEREEARGKRFFTTAGYFSNREIVEALRGTVGGKFEERLPGPEVQGGGRPQDGDLFGYDNAETNRILGLEYKSLKESVLDFAKSVEALE